MTKESDASWKVERVITSFEDLEVYKKLVELHLEVHQLTLRFPKYEMYELGSQLRELQLHSCEHSGRMEQ